MHASMAHGRRSSMPSMLYGCPTQPHVFPALARSPPLSSSMETEIYKATNILRTYIKTGAHKRRVCREVVQHIRHAHWRAHLDGWLFMLETCCMPFTRAMHCALNVLCLAAR